MHKHEALLVKSELDDLIQLQEEAKIEQQRRKTEEEKDGDHVGGTQPVEMPIEVEADSAKQSKDDMLNFIGRTMTIKNGEDDGESPSFSERKSNKKRN